VPEDLAISSQLLTLNTPLRNLVNRYNIVALTKASQAPRKLVSKKVKEVDMKSWMQIGLLPFCVLILLASTPGRPAWQMKADYVEACSCHLFCPCYFNKHAEHPHCEFNMAVKVREGHSGNTNLAGAKYWLTGDLGDEWGTNNKGEWVVVSFDPSTNKEQRDALAPMILKTYGLEWGELKVQEAPIEVSQAGDIVNATLGGGQMASHEAEA
jgi:hypothetical protein